MIARAAAFALMVALGSCGPAIEMSSAPTRPCDVISQAEFDTARQNGAAVYRAEITANGTLSGSSGVMLGRRCSDIGLPRRCVLAQDLVVSIAQEGQPTRYARVPEGATYQFNVRSIPNVCEILGANS